jgi:hypothetical protein
VGERHKPANARRWIRHRQSTGPLLRTAVKFDQKSQPSRIHGMNLLQIDDYEPLRSRRCHTAQSFGLHAKYDPARAKKLYYWRRTLNINSQHNQSPQDIPYSRVRPGSAICFGI